MNAFLQVPRGLRRGDKFNMRVKALDDQYNSQPENIRDIWNLRGCLNNSHHKIEIEID